MCDDQVPEEEDFSVQSYVITGKIDQHPNLILVDTPGFNHYHSNGDDKKIIEMISKCLQQP